MTAKRLFLFAGYNASGVIDSALLYYIRSLSEFGDIVLVMDSDCSESELSRVRPYCLYASGVRHGEYDFGSYKRAYIWATENLKLSDYDFVYMVNDSVYGPFYDLAPYFETMEKYNVDAFGMVSKPHQHKAHIQSWFIGLRPSVFMSDWYDNFMTTITKQRSKGTITRVYELGFTKLVESHNLPWRCMYSVYNRGVYNRIMHLYKIGMPFMKKVAFTRHFGAFGRQILYVMNHISPQLRQITLESARGQYGSQLVDKLLTKNPLITLFRHIRYAFYKFFTQGI